GHHRVHQQRHDTPSGRCDRDRNPLRRGHSAPRRRSRSGDPWNRQTQQSGNVKARSENVRLLIMIVVLVVADWVSKIWMISRLHLGESLTLVDGWLYFLHRQIPGVAFSMFSDLSAGVRVPLLGALSLLGIFLFSRIIMTTDDTISRYSAAAVVAGAIGNFADRMITGQVTDFILFPFFPFVFNVTDAAITVGGIILAIRLAIVPDPSVKPVPAGGSMPD